MYLISIYFDEESTNKIDKYILKCAKSSGNSFMIDHHVPVHMTLLSFQCNDENKAIEKLKQCVNQLKSDNIYFASLGVFLPHVLYLSPVLNNYLFKTHSQLYNFFNDIDSIELTKQYIPYNWIPHTTIAKTLTSEQMNKSFTTMQNLFHPIQAKVVRIALSKTNPYTDIISFNLN